MQYKTNLERSREITQWRESKGFFTPAGIRVDWFLAGISEADVMLGKLMLVVTELSEAAEAVRKEDMPNFLEELADTQIRLYDIYGALGIDIDELVEAKMQVNRGRPHKHGKKSSL